MAKYLSMLMIVCALTSARVAPAQAADLNDAMVRAYYNAWTAGDLDDVMSHFSADAVYEDVATGDLSTGRDEVRAFARKFLQSTPGVKVVPTSILIGADSAAVEWTMSAGSGDDAWSVRGAAILRHKDGRITRATDYWHSE